MNKPKFLVVGVQKAATSWLWVMLQKHSQIWCPPGKELHFFDHLYVNENRKWTRGHVRQNIMHTLKWQMNHGNPGPDYLKYLIRFLDDDIFTEEWYLRAFDRPIAYQSVCGDITPEYCTIPDEGVAYVKKLLPSSKIIMVIRDPLTRAHSQIRMNISRRGIDPDSLTNDQWVKIASEHDIHHRATYSTYIPTWEKYFDDILYIPYKSISQEPQKVLDTIFKHLSLTPENIDNLTNKVHAGKSLNIQPVATELLKNRFQSEYAYLERRFDSDFLNLI